MDTKGALPVGPGPVGPNEAIESTAAADSGAVTIRRPRSVIGFALWFSLGLGVAYLGLLIFERLRNVVLILAFSLLIGVTLDPIVTFLQRRGIQRRFAAIITWLAVVALLAAPFVLAIDAATTQLPQLIKSAPSLINNAESHLPGSLGDKLK